MAVKNGFNRRVVFGRWQIRMKTQTGDINVCRAGSLQDSGTLWNLNLLPING
jgi:hypothetical protein